jgi:hypothetical protein
MAAALLIVFVLPILHIMHVAIEDRLNSQYKKSLAISRKRLQSPSYGNSSGSKDIDVSINPAYSPPNLFPAEKPQEHTRSIEDREVVNSNFIKEKEKKNENTGSLLLSIQKWSTTTALSVGLLFRMIYIHEKNE